jgi:hypothetical protein
MGLFYISELLKENHVIEKIQLSMNFFPELGYKHLSEALRENHGLLSLDLSSILNIDSF